mmetsp:Transcript_28520/g.77212  ORF Transcript_28520/g.77212 Transcript_28520/m.77212 type:complete len:111 (-) Transcript_28520:173-505(-)
MKSSVFVALLITQKTSHASKTCKKQVFVRISVPSLLHQSRCQFNVSRVLFCHGGILFERMSGDCLSKVICLNERILFVEIMAKKSMSVIIFVIPTPRTRHLENTYSNHRI